VRNEKRGKSKPPDIAVEHTPAPDAQERLRRAFDLLLQAATRAEEKKQVETLIVENEAKEETNDDG
jgi:hypothetical protein